MSAEYRKLTQSLGLVNAPDVHPGRPAVFAVEALDVGKISDSRVPLTVNKAAEYIGFKIYPGEREVSDAHVQHLLDEMQAGRFNWDIVALASCTFRGVRYKINGQHTCWAVLGLPDGAPQPHVREIVYDVPSESQLKALYATFDRAKPRSDVHLTKMELVGTDAAEGLQSSTVQRIAPGFRYWKFPNKTEYQRVGPAELAAVVTQQHSRLFNMVGHFFQGIERTAVGIVKRRPALAAMFETFDRFPAIAPDFWRDTIEGTNLTKADARWHLRRYLESSAIQRGADDKKVVDGEEMYLTCLSAWNRWRKSDKVQALRPLATRSRAV